MNRSYEITSVWESPWLFFFPPGIAKACEQNLRKTFQYGGRNKYPNTMELKAMMVSYFIHLIINKQ